MRDSGKQADRLAAIRLRYTIKTHLDDQGISTPADIARVAGLPTDAVPSATLTRAPPTSRVLDSAAIVPAKRLGSMA